MGTMKEATKKEATQWNMLPMVILGPGMLINPQVMQVIVLPLVGKHQSFPQVALSFMGIPWSPLGPLVRPSTFLCGIFE